MLGDAAVVCGDPTAASGYYEQGLQTARSLGHRPETALLHLSLAELLARDHAADPRAVRQQLELAIPALEAMHMRPALERALRLHPPAALDPLTARERDVVALIAAHRRLIASGGWHPRANRRPGWHAGRKRATSRYVAGVDGHGGTSSRSSAGKAAS